MKAKATILSPGPTANTNLNRNNNELNGKQLSEERREMTEERNAILSELKIYEENIESHKIEFNVTPSPIPSSANKGKSNEQEGLKIDSNYHSPSSADAVSAAQRIREHLELLNQESGGIIITGHIGNWELMLPIFGINHIPLSVVVQFQRNKGAQKFFNEIRQFHGSNTILKGIESKVLLNEIQNG